MISPTPFAFLALVGLAPVACADGPAAVSVFSVELAVPSSTVEGGVAWGEVAVSSEAGDPYGAFIARAREALGGQDPSRIEIAGASVMLLRSSDDVDALGDVFLVGLAVGLVFDGSGAEVDVGVVNYPYFSGPYPCRMAWDSAAVTGDDLADLLAGRFRVRVEGVVAAGFPFIGARADLKVVLKVEAY